MRRAVFLDRDGTINVEKNYLHHPGELELIPGAASALKQLKQAGFLLVVVTNQSGIARGLFSWQQVEQLHARLQDLLAPFGAQLDDFLICPHHPTEGTAPYRRPCDCRKPAPGMLLQAAERWSIDPAASFMIGDRRADIDAGRRAGCRPVLVRTGYGAAQEAALRAEDPDLWVTDDLPAAANRILTSCR